MIKSIIIFSLAPPVGPGRLLIRLRLRQTHALPSKEYKLQHKRKDGPQIFLKSTDVQVDNGMAEAPDDRNQRRSKVCRLLVTQPLIAPVIEEEFFIILFCSTKSAISFHSIFRPEGLIWPREREREGKKASSN